MDEHKITQIVFGKPIRVSMRLIRYTTFWILLILTRVQVSANVMPESVVDLTNTPLRYIDLDEPYQTQYDGVVGIYINQKNPRGFLKSSLTVCPGVMFDSEHVLTAFNPFRQLVKNPLLKKHTYVAVLSKRLMYPDIGLAGYRFINRYIICGKQVPPMPEKNLRKDQWFGRKRLHSPVHDLIVFKVQDVVAIKPVNESCTNFRSLVQYVEIKAGPVIYNLAGPDDELHSNFSFVSTGLSDEETWKSIQLQNVQYYEFEDAIVDCEEWIPRDWGHFICINNKDNYEGIGTGAILFGDEKVFGIGSFMIQRQKQSILVFTDVRKYRHLIYESCE